MKEYLTQAIVLRNSPRGEFDKFVDLYTKNLGRIGARVIGGRRILSKLSPHLEALTLITLRLVQKNSFTVADALTQDRFLTVRKNKVSREKSQDLIFLLRKLLPKSAPDLRLWHEVLRSLQSGQIETKKILKILGYDPKLAVCELCGAKPVAYFHVSDQSFLCFKCRGKFSQNELVLIN